jgi:hypothetical protein
VISYERTVAEEDADEAVAQVMAAMGEFWVDADEIRSLLDRTSQT